MVSDRLALFVAVVAIVLVLAPAPARGYGVGPAIPLEKLAKSVDIVCKATATANRRVADPWFETLPGFATQETDFRIVSCPKGAPPKIIKFRYYTYAPVSGTGYGYSPLHYEITAGKTYIVFASAVPKRRGIYRQWSKSHTMKADQGLVLAADTKPHRGPTVTAAVRAELVGLLSSATPDDAVVGIEQLDELSGGGLSKLSDFERPAVLADIRPLVLSKDDTIAAAAIGVFGGDSPYFSDRDVPYWLAGLPDSSISGLGPRRPPGNPAANTAVKELLAVAGSSSKLRPLAIRALGRSRAVPAPTMQAWVRDPDLEVRSATVLISGEGPSRALIVVGARDPAPEVRRAAAFAVGFSQDPQLLSLVGPLLKDADGKVRAAAALAILAFGPIRAKSVMTANLKSNFGPLFVNALARSNPKPYLARLGEVIDKQLQPQDWWGGSIPAGDSWRILFAYVKARPVAELTAGTLDRTLDSLEHMKWFSSSEPRDLYALYIRRGMTGRATRFRAALKTAVSYSMDQYLDEADQHPERFVP